MFKVNRGKGQQVNYIIFNGKHYESLTLLDLIDFDKLTVDGVKIPRKNLLKLVKLSKRSFLSAHRYGLCDCGLHGFLELGVCRLCLIPDERVRNDVTMFIRENSFELGLSVSPI